MHSGQILICCATPGGCAGLEYRRLLGQSSVWRRDINDITSDGHSRSIRRLPGLRFLIKLVEFSSGLSLLDCRLVVHCTARDRKRCRLKDPHLRFVWCQGIGTLILRIPNDCLAELELLDAVIYELVLFLLLPCLVPNALLPQRVSLSETYIPGHTLVQVPLHTVFLDSNAFERPDEFIPQRWTTQLKLVKNRSNCVPLLTGLCPVI
ncbi:uncharacterized protein EURHEDRAFT_303271 [Aspergillus ruber CBS 135680]|uniref:Uncharacterized protein n=1 Tax=Aspergillus ruber (strain CBS 135680) TaxID=1388766 RepID=A0A017SLQ5_ASPRC|nr:uncharacterized protein EURHEDRAFT_303271 [Aspergillus ruber CBS 135680]EYE97706.1 hypothetical protein EURHEDRAFT_303271 [Aspergillus ruber CBS 135680]